MRLTSKAAAGVLAICFGGPAAANNGPALTFEQGQALAKQMACLGCHQVKAKRVGPGFTQVAQRFAGQPDAFEYLSQMIRKGGRGKWGAIPMPAQTQVSEQQAKRLAQWILSLEP
jgi:cytochrome c